MSNGSANPLLLEWIKELWDVAKERNSKGATTYKKAFESMKACPLTFNHPSEAQQLDGIGPKICEHLATRLEAHCEANGLPKPKKGKRKRRTGEELPEGLSEDYTPIPAKKPRNKKAYVPALRSGAYALMLALSSRPEDSFRSFSKADLVMLAQPDCDSSFEVSSEGNKFYTAWNSMKTLVEKDLVQEMGRPSRKYYLSDEGWEVAKKIRAVQARNDQDDVGPKVRRNTKEKETRQLSNERSQPTTASAHSRDLEKDSRRARTAQSEQTQSRSKSPALMIFGDRETKTKDLHPKPKTATQPGTVSSAQGHIRESNIIDLLSSPEPDYVGKIPKDRDHGLEDAPTGVTANISQKTSSVQSSSYANESRTKPTPLSSAPRASLPKSIPSCDPIEIPPGTFTVQLVLDTREIRTTTDRDYIFDELRKKRIKPILRALELGDFFWIAKLHNPTHLYAHGETDEHSDELALDWIVERKRLDDLVSSITDGRFSEQKFRLKKSGVKNVIYLIEDFSLSSEKETRFHDAIQTAIASTQVVNGFFVKKTQKVDDSIRYIARLTHLLQQLYESKPLHLIPTRCLEGDNYLPLLNNLRTSHPSRTYSLTYSTFATLSSKTDNLTLRDVFTKMLLCTRGLSAEKALAIQRKWKTPRALVEALEGCETSGERDGLVAGGVEGVVLGRAKIGGALSKKVGEIWGEE